MLSLHRPTSSSSSTTNFQWLPHCLLVSLLLVTCNCFTYVHGRGTDMGSTVNTSRDRYLASLLARRSDLKAVSHLLPTAASRVRNQVWSCEIRGGQSGSGASFLRVFWCPCQSSLHRLIRTHPLSTRTSTMYVQGRVSPCTATSMWSIGLVQ
jgi:hypothetical protein